MDLGEIGWEILAWVHLAQDRDQYLVCCKHGIEPSGSIKGSDFLERLSASQEGLCSMESLGSWLHNVTSECRVIFISPFVELNSMFVFFYTQFFTTNS